MLHDTRIEWTDKTWKIISGCEKNCPYCYVKRFDKNWDKPAFHQERLQEPLKLKEPSMIFVANTGDAFGSWVPEEWIMQMMRTIEQCPNHIFQLLTKNPQRYLDMGYEFPPQCWVGTSVTCQDDVHRIDTLKRVPAQTRFISFEPLLGFIDYPDLHDIGWAIIGAESIRNSHTPNDVVSAQKWAAPLIEQVRKAQIPLFLKPNLKWKEKIQEMPYK